jgi:NADPH2 dehydrogenase
MAVSSGMVSSTTKAFLRMDMISTVICVHFSNLISRNISKQAVFVEVIYTLCRGYTLFLPVNTGYVENGLPSDRLVEFYTARSGNGLYCSIVGNIVIPNGFGSNNACAEISDSGVWMHLSNAISDQGAKPGIQLSSTWENYLGIKRFVPSRSQNTIAEYKAAVKEISPKKLMRIYGDLHRGVELSVQAGFQHIQIHAAHGYLFSLLIDDSFYQYSDLALNNLNRLARNLTSESIESSLRFSLITGDLGIDKNRKNLIDTIVALPFTYFDLSAGFYNIDKRLIYPISKKLLASRRDSAFDLAKRFPNIQIILSGKSYRTLARSTPENIHIGICRDLIANPNFLFDHRGCTNRMKCHYFSRGEPQLTCDMW